MFEGLAHRSHLSHENRVLANDAGFTCVKVPAPFEGMLYGTLFDHCLINYEAICLGLYRVVADQTFVSDPDSGAGSTHLNHPFVYTNPPETTMLRIDDHVFLLGPPGFDFDFSGDGSLDLNSKAWDIKFLIIAFMSVYGN